MHHYKTIVFDLDGTLFKTDTIFVEALQELCADREIDPWSRESIVGLIGVPMVDICRQIFGSHLSDEEIERIRVRVRAIEEERLSTKGSLYDSTAEMLAKLKEEGYRLCICSNGSGQHVHSVLNAFGLIESFEIIKSRVEGVSKAQLIKQILEESRSTRAIMVGDRLIDYEAADEAGCLSIGVSYGYGGEEYEQADFVAHQAMDIYYLVKKINDTYKELAGQIIENKRVDKPILVGINGVDTSGKTTLTRELGNYLRKSGYKVQIIHMDDFHNPSRIRLREADPVMTYINNAFNLERLECELLKPIAEGECIHKELMLLDLEADEFSMRKSYHVDGETIVLIEGVMLYRDPIGQYMDLKIYLDISFEEVLKRACERDGYLFGDKIREKYEKKYIPAQRLYHDTCSPKKKSDVIIQNEDYNNPRVIKQQPKV